MTPEDFLRALARTNHRQSTLEKMHSVVERHMQETQVHTDRAQNRVEKSELEQLRQRLADVTHKEEELQKSHDLEEAVHDSMSKRIQELEQHISEEQTSSVRHVQELQEQIQKRMNERAQKRQQLHALDSQLRKTEILYNKIKQEESASPEQLLMIEEKIEFLKKAIQDKRK